MGDILLSDLFDLLFPLKGVVRSWVLERFLENKRIRNWTIFQQFYLSHFNKNLAWFHGWTIGCYLILNLNVPEGWELRKADLDYVDWLFLSALCKWFSFFFFFCWKQAFSLADTSRGQAMKLAGEGGQLALLKVKKNWENMGYFYATKL